jgi:hypothetical protein
MSDIASKDQISTNRSLSKGLGSRMLNDQKRKSAEVLEVNLIERPRVESNKKEPLKVEIIDKTSESSPDIEFYHNPT